MDLVERYSWIPSIGAQYFVAVDALGLTMVLLASVVVPLGLLASWRIEENPKAYVSLLLLLQTGLFGAFTALNFFHWFIFWELSLVPAYFLIKLWGGPQRVRAATQFLLYTFLGSITLLLGFIAIFLATGFFDFIELAKYGRTMADTLAAHFVGKLGWKLSAHTLALIVFGGIFLGFAVKVPLMPFHTWLPGAYAEAPTGVAMVLTGVMSKMGLYGFLRILLPLFPAQMRAVLPFLLWLAAATIVAGALAAFAQRDLKRMLAYSSINHLGYCLLGIFAAARLTDASDPWLTEKAAALNGVLLQMLNHGITAATLFWFVGLLEQRTGRRGLDDFGGLRKVAPVFCGLMGIALFSSLGLPGLNGFVGEFLIFKGSFALAPGPTAASALGLLVTAIFLLTLLQRVFNGPLNPAWADFRDLTIPERLTAAPLIAAMFVLGVCPQLAISLFNNAVLRWVEQLKP